jgi:hypothetical protein
MRKLFAISGLVIAVCTVVGYFVMRGKIDTDKADRHLKVFAERVAPVQSVTCPETKIEKGKAFECKVRFAAGTDASITVTMLDDDGKVEYRWTREVETAEHLDAMIADGIKTQANKVATVDCGKGIVEIAAAGVRCRVVVDGQVHEALVSVDEKAKHLVWNVQ